MMRQYVKRFSRIHRPIMWAVELVIFALSGVAAFLLRFDFSLPAAYLHHLVYALPIWIVVKLVVFRVTGLDRGWWRYVSVSDLQRIAIGNFAGSVLSCIAILFIAPTGFPRSIYVLDLMICFLATSGIRLIVRMMAEAASYARSSVAEEKRTLIYGAGDAGITLLREIRNNPRLSYHVMGFLDDRPDKKGLRLAGVSGARRRRRGRVTRKKAQC
jgi:FlaA1/EpsC-like NDP-sugar epimerase